MKNQLQPTQFLLYKSENGRIKVDVLVQDETVWLTQEQMAGLFGRDRTVISKHIKNIFQEGELIRNAVVAKYWVTEVAYRVIDECLQLHGGYGCMNEYLVARMYADARIQRIYGGTSEIMNEVIARSL